MPATLTGDTDRPAATLLAGLQVGRTLENGTLLIDYLVRIACATIAKGGAKIVFSKVSHVWLQQPAHHG